MQTLSDVILWFKLTFLGIIVFSPLYLTIISSWFFWSNSRAMRHIFHNFHQWEVTLWHFQTKIWGFLHDSSLICWSKSRGQLGWFLNFYSSALKVVFATFLLVCFFSLNENTCQTSKNAFYFTSKAFFILEKIKF